MALVGYWPLTEDSGSTAYDYSGTGVRNDASVNGATQGVSGLLGQTAYSFDGTDDYLEASGLTDLSGPNQLTVSAWCKSHTANWNDTGWMVSRRNQFIIHPNSGGNTVNFYVHTTTSNWTNVSHSPSDITVWHHYLQTYDGSTLRAYVDAEEVGSVSISETLTSDTGVVQIGKDDTNARYGDADIAEVRVYDHALAPGEIQHLYDTVQSGHATFTVKPTE